MTATSPLQPASEPAHRWPLAQRAAGLGGELSAILSLASPGQTITFSGGFPAPETFPTEALTGMLAEAVGAEAGVALQYTPTEGLPSLRATLSTWLADTQSLRPADDELMVTSGGIEALSLLARCLVDPADTVLVESPTYLGAITAFTGFEARVEAVPSDSDGLDPQALEHRLRRGPRPRLLYVIPDFQNPTGRWASNERREAIARICLAHDLLLVEDVAYRELAFHPEARPSLAQLAPEVVVQVGTFSKIFFPGVRLGWATGPAEVIAPMVAAKQNSDQCAGGLGQWLVERYLREGQLEPQLRGARTLYASRAQGLLGALGRHLPDGCSWTSPLGGFFTWVSAPPSVDTAALLPRAGELGVAYVPGAPFFPANFPHNHLRLSFSRVKEEDIEEGARRLGGLLAEAIKETR